MDKTLGRRQTGRIHGQRVVDIPDHKQATEQAARGGPVDSFLSFRTQPTFPLPARDNVQNTSEAKKAKARQTYRRINQVLLQKI